MAFFVGLGACLAVLCAGLTTTGLVGWFALKSRVPNGRAPKRLYERADLIVSAQGLFTSYCESVPLADRTYNGKILEVSGTVANSGRDGKGEYVIFAVVRPSSGFERPGDIWGRIAAASISGVQGVRCYFAAAKAPRVEAEESITLRGRCSGMPLDVEIHECETVP
jgi:hypothetical protein